MKKVIFYLFAMIMVLTLKSSIVSANQVITPVSIKNYEELNTLAENGSGNYIEINVERGEAYVDFTLTKSGYVRALAVATFEKGNKNSSINFKSKSLITSYNNSKCRHNITTTGSGIYTFDAASEKLDAGTYTIQIYDYHKASYTAKLYLGYVPEDTEFLSATYSGVSTDISKGKGMILTLNSLDKIAKVSVTTTLSISNASSNSDLNFHYKEISANQVIVPTDSKYSIYVNIWIEDVLGYKYHVYYGYICNDNTTVEGIKDYYYTGKAIKQKNLIVKSGKYTTPKYKVTYKNNKKVGTATVTIEGTGEWIGKVTKTFKIKKDKIKPTIKGVKNKKTYKKAVTIKFSDKQTGIKKATLNGKKIKSGKKIKKKGKYTLKVYDKAGNVKTIKFVIKN